MWQRIKNIYHFFVAIFANIFFFFPARDMKVIAVTGTDGKTTTVNLIYHILKSSGAKASMISSISAVIDNRAYDTGFHVTTPASFSLQKFLRKARNKKSEYFVLEVTSHAIDQNRIVGIPIKVGVLTNVTNEHLDYHKTYDNYLETKIKLLKKAKICVVNSDDSSYMFLSKVKSQKTQGNWITYGLSESADYNKNTFDIKGNTLLGEFNQYNVLASVAACKTLGITDESIKKALQTFREPIGRVDYVYQEDFSVMIDFAHTSNASEQILKALRPTVKGSLIHVFGSAGERDVLKRPFLGEISSEYCDIIILTAEDPRTEDVNAIIAEIEVGIKKGKCEVIRIPDRKEAIQAAVQMAKKDDLVLITGKSQEGSMNYGKGEEPWDEYEMVKEALEARAKT
ncbi:MAG TPA: UDP-N-acetylmuramoyl-L-alanyl-D-glutamate--2,6-diaminopimelate ligase [Patescibacteria group bacterium]|jgi:UDP-N-acetylmuramoyl-L-alanyl-D-glutamate--2,6-diaminopimelate ligase|nr:UDP-N-acetylmuramoyl-L-alanyl-D-glutamate--2,6-diaminopimelate ligase [Patescibacteria group bacterium]